MQKPNPVIKNYILSSEIKILEDILPKKTIETSLYRLLSEQNKVYSSLPPAKIQQTYR